MSSNHRTNLGRGRGRGREWGRGRGSGWRRGLGVNGPPSVTQHNSNNVNFPDRLVEEARDRIHTAEKNSSIGFYQNHQCGGNDEMVSFSTYNSPAIVPRRDDKKFDVGMSRGIGRGRGLRMNEPSWMAQQNINKNCTQEQFGESAVHEGRHNYNDDRNNAMGKSNDIRVNSSSMQQHRSSAHNHRKKSVTNMKDSSNKQRTNQSGSNDSNYGGYKESTISISQNKSIAARQQNEIKQACVPPNMERLDNIDAKKIEEQKNVLHEKEREENIELQEIVEQFDANGDNWNVGSNEHATMGGADVHLFESVEEKEARMAQERRKQRKIKLAKILNDGRNCTSANIKKEKQIPEPKRRKFDEWKVSKTELSDKNTDVTYVVNDIFTPNKIGDSTRNLSGIFQSELYQNEENGGDELNKLSARKSKVEDDGKDSFDIFTSSVSPLPSTNENSINHTTIKSSRAISTTTAARAGDDAGNHDDSEGYYKANIGEIIAFPLSNDSMHTKQKNLYYNDKLHNNSSTEIKFKVLGIVGKGVFSTVLKCVHIRENSQQVTSVKSDIIAMKLIRNNETMAKAAQKEVRILRLLCYSSSTSATKQYGKVKAMATSVTTEDQQRSSSLKDVDDESSKKEAQRRLRNHNIVRLLELNQDFDLQCEESNNNDNNSSTNENSKATKNVYQYYQQNQHLLLEYRLHTTLLFEHLPFNLRETLAKFGKNIGINLKAVKSYGKQLLVALSHLAAHRVVHADIKPDNILVSANFSMVKLCDFGSAFFETDSDNEPTPYLVSRFYRAPEIILGLEYDRMVDLWSVAVTLAELFTGSVLFPGRSNNDQLRRFMETVGRPFSNKIIRRHIVSYTSRLGLQPHFEALSSGGNYNFRRQEFDKVTGKPVIRIVSCNSVAMKSKRIDQIILQARSGNDDRGEVLKFANFLGHCLTLDPGRRIDVEKALVLI